MVAIVVVAAWSISGSRAALISAVCLGLIILLNLWNHSMVTLANVLVATALTLVIGIAIGIATARNARLRSLLRPLLDAAQTMPAFVYLIPAVALFLPSRFTAIVAAVIFAVPPVIRLVEVGILSVPIGRGRGGHLVRRHRPAAAVQGPAADVARGRCCSPPTRASSWCCRWWSSAHWSARAR